MLDRIANDVRYAARTLRTTRVATLTTVLTLGIGIGLLTAIFSIVNAAVLRPLPYEHSDRLVAITETNPREHPQYSIMSPAAFAAVRERNRSFAAVAAYSTRTHNIRVASATQPVSGAEVSATLFGLLRVAPLRGRVFTADEAAADARVVVIAHELWTTRLGASESVVGSTMRVDGEPYTIIGVMPSGFNFPNREQFWRPLIRRPGDDAWTERSLAVAARLRDGVTLAAARSDVATIGAAFAREQAALQDGWSMQVRSELFERRSDFGALLWMTVAAGLFMLLIACANVATVLLARAAARRGEMAVRAALGASRWRLARQHLTETLLLALGGGVAGLIIATWALELAYASLPTDHVPSWLEFGIDWRVLLFTLGIAGLALVAVGVGPALAATHVQLSDPLKAGTAGDTASRRELRSSRVLVIVEVAAAFVLFAGSALMVQSFRRLQRFDFGFDARHVLFIRPWLSGGSYEVASRREAYFSQAADRVSRMGGVRSVAMRGGLDSLRGAGWAGDSAVLRRERGAVIVRGDDATAPLRDRFSMASWVVTPSYFDVMGLRVLRGRALETRDVEGAPRVAVVSTAAAERLWPGTDPVGRQFRLGGSAEWVTVVGVVADVQTVTSGPRGVAGRAERAVYFPVTQATSRLNDNVLLARTTGDPLMVAAAARRAASAVDSDQAISRVRRLSDELGEGATPILWLGVLFATIATGALLLASIGLYGVIAYSVTRRTREIGVRMALGADAAVLRRSVLTQALRLTATGLVIGIAGAWALVRLVGSFLYGVSSYDPVTYAAVTVLFVMLAMAASYVPARRATRVDPLIALRAQ